MYQDPSDLGSFNQIQIQIQIIPKERTLKFIKFKQRSHDRDGVWISDLNYPGT